ncbi:energy transducer TonB [Flammeovirga sp. SJP92]|uniref:energy transducer TonB n=1 Tax=Flammeovirga sp. SJP92 TaxID=1775430 RepID=UPI0007896F27|nr:energy transducer TonB [Flammeovirga sp. SJP92]KXX71377.1 hypothetical protein AVL50_05600 [Flammeovirga sp. SJP92]
MEKGVRNIVIEKDHIIDGIILKSILFTLLLFSSLNAFSQQDLISCNDHYETSKTGVVYDIVDKPAKPLKGLPQLYKKLAKNMKYPTNIKKLGVEGRIFITFTVTREGEIADLQCIMAHDEILDQEEIYQLLSEEDWEVGLCNGVKVSSRIIIPMYICLR